MQTSYKLIFFSLFLFIFSLSNEIFALNFPNADKSRELTIEGYKDQEIYSDYKNAIKKYTKALNINPKNLYALLNRAYSRYQIKDTSGAWDDLNRALAIDPNNGVAIYNRAIVNTKLGHRFDAIKDYSKAINKDIELKNAYAVRGIHKSMIGDPKGACSDWEKSSKNGNERVILWVKDNCTEYTFKEFQRKTKSKVLISNATRKYFRGEIKSACEYYQLAKNYGYKGKNLKNKIILLTVTEPLCFIF